MLQIWNERNRTDHNAAEKDTKEHDWSDGAGLNWNKWGLKPQKDQGRRTQMKCGGLYLFRL